MFSRLRQVGYFLWPQLPEGERLWALGQLNSAQQGLFSSMGKSDQAHAVRVARRLAALSSPIWVLEAALLHDCGKPAGFGLLGRCAGVILSPYLKANLKGGLWRWIEIYRHHDQWGIEAAEKANTSQPALQLLGAARPNGATPPEEVAAWLPVFLACDARG